ncbi:DUF2442 domain-containing protein [Rudanella lutea]|uniref:DUF2442 domain-containing protein n=1 Tax=Rudanella lutea TaxID=451374 RepID=UPI0012FAF9F4|nr:DUF2442 domain-containing protein [Rudanella lutea]
MQPSSAPGTTPSVSNRLAAWLQDESEQPVTIREDEFDRLIAAQSLQIVRFVFFREIDMFILILNNRKIINRRLSEYPFLARATDAQLSDYSVSVTGIHWPQLDADLSLRGFLMQEAVAVVQAYPSVA